MATATLSASVCWLDRLPLYKHEKPYEVRFPPPPGFPRTNMQISQSGDLFVHDVRGREASLSLEKNGFYVMELDDSLMGLEAFGDKDAIESIYLPQVANSLKKTLGASRVQMHDYLVRKSHERFPVSTGKPYDWEQPATLLHIDTTPDGTAQLCRDLNGDEKSEELLSKMRCQYITIWKPIRGPVKRWPLLLVDNSTVDQNQDLEARDVVYADNVVDTFMIYPSASYKFEYISNQKTTEALVMLQSDSKGLTGTPHTSFFNPLALESDPQRESIEVRALVFYEESE